MKHKDDGKCFFLKSMTNFETSVAFLTLDMSQSTEGPLGEQMGARLEDLLASPGTVFLH